MTNKSKDNVNIFQLMFVAGLLIIMTAIFGGLAAKCLMIIMEY